MSTPVNVAQQVAALQDQIRSLASQVKQLQANQRSSANLANSSIANGAITFTDANNNPQVVVGIQADGTFTMGSLNSPGAPAQPDPPNVAAGLLCVVIGWDGLLQNALPLTDFTWVEVHLSTQPNFTPSAATLQGVLHTAGLFPVTGLQGGTTYYACLLARNEAGTGSNPSVQVSATPTGSVPAPAFSPTPPVNPVTGQLWYNTAQGYLLQEWDGTQWQPYQFGTGAIAAGSVTAALIAANTITAAQIAAGTITAAQIQAGTINASLLSAGIVYAGIVNGTTIMGAQFIAYGTNGEILVYSGAPASNNLIVAISGASGTDSFGTPFAEGVEVKQGGLILDNQSSAPTVVSGASLFYSSVAGRPRYISQAGNDSVLERSTVNVASFPSTNPLAASPAIVSAPMTYLANEGAQSSEYEIEIIGSGTWGTSFLNGWIMQLFVDGAAVGTSGQFTIGTSGQTLAATFGYRIAFGISLLSASTALFWSDGTVYDESANRIPANSVDVGSVSSSTSFDSTTAHTLQVYVWWAASAGGQTHNTVRTRISRRM